MEHMHFTANETLRRLTTRPPEKVFGDYMKIAYLTVFFIIGSPVNLAAYFQMSDAPLSVSRHVQVVHATMNSLKRNLNYADLMIIFLYVTSEACWLVSYEWRGGDMLCKFVMFGRMLAFQISSNVIVCIAITRCLSLLLPNRYELIRVRIMIALAWLHAVLSSAPQFHVWMVVQPYAEYKWHQCATIWEIGRESTAEPKGNASTVHSSGPFVSQETYNILHLLNIFWIPLCLIVLSYVTLLFTLQTKKNEAQKRKRNSIMMREREETFENSPAAAIAAQGIQVMAPIVHEAENQCIVDVMDERIRTARNKTARISIILVSAYVICWTPYNLITVWKVIDWDFYRYHLQDWDNLQALMVLKSVINPFLYGMFGPMRRYASAPG